MRRLWVIVVLLVALPLQGWAAATMAAQPGAGWEPSGMAGATAGGFAGAFAGAFAGDLPCHGIPEPSGGLHDQADLGVSSHSCEVCQLCHAWQAVLTEDAPVPAPAASPAPPSVHPSDTGRLMAAGLERPPRR
jgi:hypothetical protein